MEKKLYPIKFEPILKDKIWGGDKLKKQLNKSLATDQCGESWEISGVQGDVSVVSNGWLKGNSLEEIIEVYMGDLIGEKVYDEFGTTFPLLIKYIDANDDLSIQVHPNDEVGMERHQSFGKTEMWYIVDADEKARLVIGFNRELGKKEYVESLKNGQLENIMNNETIEKGDIYFIPAGRVHAIGAGTLIAEIQQTSDITYRIYDYKRKDKDGNERELHTELALDVIDFKYYDTYKTPYKTQLNNTVETVECTYFKTNVIELDQVIMKDYALMDSFVIFMCVEGNVQVGSDGEFETLNAGETMLIPADLNNVIIKPAKKSKLLEVYIK